jgi:hypothetical protein
MEIGGLGFSGFAAMMRGRIANDDPRGGTRLGGKAAPSAFRSSRAAVGGTDLPSRLAARETLLRTREILVAKLRSALADVISKLDGSKREIARLRQENATLQSEVARLGVSLGAVQSSAQKVWRAAGRKRAAEPEFTEPEVEAEAGGPEEPEVVDGEVVEVEDDPFGPDDDGMLG